MKKDVHTYIDSEIIKQVTELAKKDGIKLKDEYEKLLKLAINSDNLEKKIEHLINSINKNNSSLLYIKKLEEQIYADLGLPQINPDGSLNLKSFKEKYRKEKNKYND